MELDGPGANSNWAPFACDKVEHYRSGIALGGRGDDIAVPRGNHCGEVKWLDPFVEELANPRIPAAVSGLPRRPTANCRTDGHDDFTAIHETSGVFVVERELANFRQIPRQLPI